MAPEPRGLEGIVRELRLHRDALRRELARVEQALAVLQTGAPGLRPAVSRTESDDAVLLSRAQREARLRREALREEARAEREALGARTEREALPQESLGDLYDVAQAGAVGASTTAALPAEDADPVGDSPGDQRPPELPIFDLIIKIFESNPEAVFTAEDVNRVLVEQGVPRQATDPVNSVRGALSRLTHRGIVERAEGRRGMYRLAKPTDHSEVDNSEDGGPSMP